MWRRFSYWQSSFGYPRQCLINYAAQPSSLPSTTEGTLQTMSYARIIQIAEGLVTGLSPTIPPSAVYPSVKQAVRLVCLSTAGYEFTIILPAPRLPIFGADAVTVQPANLAAILTAATLDGVVDPYGNAISAIVSGVLNGNAYPGDSNA